MRTRPAAALAMLALLCAAAHGRQAGAGVQRLSVPGQKLALEISLPGFVVEEDKLRGDGKARMIMAGDKERGYVVSVFFEPLPSAGKTARDFRDEQAARVKVGAPVKVDDVKTSERGAVPTLEYLIKEFRGRRVNQKHFNAYFVKDGMWVDVHFSKLLFEEGDERVFHAAVDSVRFVGDSGAAAADTSPTAFELLGEGSKHFLRGDYRAAIGPYSRALELEKQSPRLERDLWRVLVDNLGMSYGISGDLKRARETFEYGLSKDPDYPMFHYNMACTYAEMGDLDNAIKSLRQAFAHKQNMIPGETMPDPRTDSSFARYRKDKKFLKALEEIGLPARGRP